LTVTAIESPLMEKFKDRIQWKVNGSDPYTTVGMKLQEGNFLDLTTKISSSDNIISEYSLFDIQPKVAFTDNSGTYYNERHCSVSNNYHNYSFMDLYRYIKAREAF